MFGRSLDLCLDVIFFFTFKPVHADFRNHELFILERSMASVFQEVFGCRLQTGPLEEEVSCRSRELERLSCVRTCTSGWPGSALLTETEDERLKSAYPSDGLFPS